MNASIQQIEKQIKELQEQQQMAGKFSVKNEILKVLASNRTKLMSYAAIGESVPAQLWLTYFLTQGDGQISIKGGASTVEEVYLFFKTLKIHLLTAI